MLIQYALEQLLVQRFPTCKKKNRIESQFKQVELEAEKNAHKTLRKNAPYQNISAWKWGKINEEFLILITSSKGNETKNNKQKIDNWQNAHHYDDFIEFQQQIN